MGKSANASKEIVNVAIKRSVNASFIPAFVGGIYANIRIRKGAYVSLLESANAGDPAGASLLGISFLRIIR